MVPPNCWAISDMDSLLQPRFFVVVCFQLTMTLARWCRHLKVSYSLKKGNSRINSWKDTFFFFFKNPDIFVPLDLIMMRSESQWMCERGFRYRRLPVTESFHLGGETSETRQSCFLFSAEVIRRNKRKKLEKTLEIIKKNVWYCQLKCFERFVMFYVMF